MIRYVAGFLIDKQSGWVALIHKTRPAWMVGKLNGIGGKIEDNETALQAMRREFLEETSVQVSYWRQFLTLSGPDFNVYFFVAFAGPDTLRSVVAGATDERIDLYDVLSLPANVIPNLKWILPLALDSSVVEAEAREG